MWYPKRVYNANENVTRNNMAEYERRVAKWEKKRDEMFPNYFKLKLRERMKLEKEVDEVMGYSRWD